MTQSELLKKNMKRIQKTDKISSLMNDYRCSYGRFYSTWIEIAIQEKGEPKCSVCGYDRCFAAIDFHHTGTKTFNISTLFHYPPTAENVRIFKEELGNCVMLCANCHREEHQKKNIKKRARRQKYLELKKLGIE